ncbi:tetratricopeptide repeat protein [Streptomyces sp. NPDC051976]|uniref:tetratricopeptide repeat protein n=1 Tax=Streptomyces sp. NPDC051976 TaxID=3154947 RepID=UPI003423F774
MPSTLPVAAGVFVGRERELEGLRGDIGRAGLGRTVSRRARVLLVAGRPGAGRTAVALRLAGEVEERYRDGRFFVRLTGDDGEPVPAAQTARTLLRAMGAPEAEDTADPAAALRAAAADRRMLFVLDDVVRADQLEGLLPDAPDSLVVATSDGPLSGIPDVRPCTLGGLDTPAAVELLSHVIGSTRVTCDPRAAETLVQEVGGHPTALRLVASWLAALPRLSVADAATRLRAVSAENPPEPAAARASTPGELVRAFRLVYEDLPPTAARMLRLLSLAPAGMVDAQVASALAGCSVAAAQSTLDDFVSGALLTATGSTPAAPPPQYRLPGCLEPLLRALLETGDRPEDVRLARARMLERTVRLLQSCRAALAGEAPEAQEDGGAPTGLRFGSRAAAADWLRSRLPALLASARAAVADGALDTLARRLVAVLVQALTAFPGAGRGARGDAMAAERYELHGLVLDVAERRGLHREKAAALINLADLDVAAGRGARALERYRAALEPARAGADPEAEGRVLEALAGTYQQSGDLQRAADWYGRALALRQARGESGHQARLHGRIGALLTYSGRYGPALREWRAAAGIYRRLGDLPAQARALTEAARVQEYAGYPEDALRSCRDALYWARKAGERRLEAAVLLRLADTLDRLGDPSGAGLQRAAANQLLNPGQQPQN